MNQNKLKTLRRQRRKRRIRKRLFGTADRPRLSVTRSLRNIAVQIIDDDAGRTLVQAGTANKDIRPDIGYGGNIQAAQRIGQIIAERAKASGIEAVVFDRNGRDYHGRLKGLAEAAREGGLKF